MSVWVSTLLLWQRKGCHSLGTLALCEFFPLSLSQAIELDLVKEESILPLPNCNFTARRHYSVCHITVMVRYHLGAVWLISRYPGFSLYVCQVDRMFSVYKEKSDTCFSQPTGPLVMLTFCLRMIAVVYENIFSSLIMK